MNAVFAFHELLATQAQQNGDKPAVFAGETVVSFQKLNEHVDHAAAILLELGVQRGDRVGICLPKSVDEIVATFAISRLGAVFVNINYGWTVHQLNHVVSDCGIKVLFTDNRKKNQILRTPLWDLLESVIARNPKDEEKDTRCCLVNWNRTPLSPKTPNPIVDVVDEDLAALLYTSGSTGLPKGVMLTHRNLIAGAQSVARYLENTAEDRLLSLLPLSFDYGLSQITTAFLVGASVVLQLVSIPAELIKTIQKYTVTGFAAVPTVWIELVKYLSETRSQIEKLRYITNSGGKIPSRVLEQIPSLIPNTDVYLMYGLTEAFRSSYLPPNMFEEKMGSIGKAIPNAELFVIDQSKGLCGPGEEGELVHRGPLISKGYWGNPEASSEKIRPNRHLSHLIGDEPVLHSGDLVTRDEHGYLWFVGRRDGLIKSSGYRVSPEEVEERLYRYPNMRSVVAFGVADDHLGESIHIAVVLDQTELSQEENERSIMDFCRTELPNYMVPRKVHMSDAPLPLTGSGKPDRPKIKSTLLS